VIGLIKRGLPMGLSYAASGLSLLLSAAAQLITFAVLARTLGTSQFAVYITISAFTNIGTQICGIGSQESLVRRVARELSFYPTMFGHTMLLTVGTGIALILIGIGAVPLLLALPSEQMPTLTSIVFLLITNILLVKIIGVATAAYVAHSNFKVANGMEIGFALMRMLTTLLGCLVFGVKTVDQWAIWMFGSHTLLTLAYLYMMWRIGRPAWRIVREEIPIGALFSTQFIFRALRQNTDLVVLSMIASPEIVGSYGVARRILDSSYMSIEALNRLIYPGSARILVHGFHVAYPRLVKVLMAAVGIAVAVSLTVFVLSPLMPILFGHQYISMVGFTRAICFVIVPAAVSGVILEVFGAAGKQGVRAMVFNSANLVSAGLVAVITLNFGVFGAFGSYYAVEIVTAVIAWYVLSRYVMADRLRFEGAAPGESRSTRPGHRIGKELPQHA